MDKDELVPLVLAFLAVLALGASAATLDSVRHDPVGIGGSDEGVGQGDSGSSFDLGSQPPLNTSGSDSSALTPILRSLFSLFLILGFIGIVVVIYREGWRSLLPLAVPIAIIALVLLVLFYLLDPSADRPGKGGLLGGKNLSLPSGGSLNGVREITPKITNHFSTIVLVLLGVTIVVAAVVLVRATGDDPLFGGSDTGVDESGPESSTVESVAVGKAAGRAADRIETDTPLSNAIYSAWQDMTTYLDLPQETSTPGEFADAAVASGMTRDDVDELTELFEATRYGGIDASEERERRALAALRRVEREYADSDGDR